jgi:fibronectin-binding autotransporter adhesin
MRRHLLSLLFFAITSPTVAATLYWDGSAGTSWADLENWTSALSGGSTPAAVPAAADTVIFNADGFANALSTLGGAQAVTGMTFNGNASGGTTLGTLNDHALTLGTGGLSLQSGAGAVTLNSSVVIGGVQVWNHQSSSTLTVAGNVALNNHLTLSGTGPVAITGPITATGNRTLTLNGTGAASVGDVSNPGTFVFSIAAGSSLDVNGVVSGSSVEKFGAGTVVFNGSNTHTGNLRVRDGTIVLNQSYTSSVQLIFGAANGSNGADGFGTLSLSKSDAAAVALNLTGTVYVHNTSDGAQITSTGSGAFAPVVNLNGERIFMIRDVVPEADLRVSIGLANGSGIGVVTKRSLGVMLMEGDNTYTGATNVDRGRLILDYQLNNGDNKLSNTAATNLRGGWLELRGNNSAASSETISSLVVGVGSNKLAFVSNGGQELTLNLTGNLTRSANTAAVVVGANHNNSGILNVTSNAGLLTHLVVNGAAPANNAAGFIGGWLIFNGERWGARSGNEITVFTGGVTQNNKSLWTTTDSIIVDGPIMGILSTPEVASLIFDHPSGGTLTLNNNASVLTLSQSALLVSSDTTSDVTISGGQLMTKNSVFDAKNELIITNLSAAKLTLSANLGTSNTYLSATQNITFAGPGLIELTGSSSATAANTAGTIAAFNNLTVTINGDVLLSSVNALGAYSYVSIGAAAETTANGARLSLNGGTAVIGRLLGGRGGDPTYSELGPGEVALGANGNLTLNQITDSTYSGLISGTGVIVKKGAATLTLQNYTSTYSGQFHVLGGGLILTSGTTTLTSLNALLIRGGSVNVNQNLATAVDHLRSGMTLSLQGTSGSGYSVTSDNRPSGTQSETVSVLSLEGGANTLTVNNTRTVADAATTVMSFNGASSLVRTNKSSLLVRGRNLGLTTASAGSPASQVIFTNTTALFSAMIGTASTSTGSTTNLRILPYAIGENNTTSATNLAGVGNSFLTYGAGGTGLRVLTDNEYATDFSAAATDDNVSLNASLSGASGKTINSLRLQNNGANVDLTGSGSLVLTSGALLFTAAASDNDASVSGFDSITSGATVDELVVSVTSAHATPTGAVLTLGTAIVDNGQAVSLTKSGNGTLILGGNNTYTGETTINQGVLEFGAGTTGNLGSGLLRLAGGTLRWGAGNTTDITSGGRVVQLLGASVYLTPSAGGNILNAGNVLDLGSNNVTLAGAIGNGGYGGLTVTMGSANSLTLSAAPNYTGATTVLGGTVNFDGGIAAGTTEALYLIRTATGTGTVTAGVTGGLNVKSLVVGGAYGTDAGSTTGNLTISSGVVNINDPSSFVLIGYRDATAGTGNSANVTSTADFTLASAVTINTSQLELGIYKGLIGTANLGVGGALLLSNGANQITAGSIIIGHAATGVSNIGVTSSITLGSSTNVINTDTWVIGGGRSVGTVTIRANGSFTLRGRQGGDIGANLFIADNEINGTNVDTTGTLNLTGASQVDAVVNLLILGRIANSGGAGAGKGTLTYDTGSFNVTTIRMADANYSTGSATNIAESNGTLNQRGTATLRYQTLSTPNATTTTSAGATISTTVANHNWQGGTIQNLAGDNLTNVNVNVNLTQFASESLLDPSRRTFTVDQNQTATFQARWSTA